MAKSEVYPYYEFYNSDPYPYTIAKGHYQIVEPNYTYKEYEFNLTEFQKMFGPQGVTLSIGGNSNMAKTVPFSEIQEGDVINVVFEKQTVSRVTKENGETLIETRNGRTVYGTTNGNAPSRFEMVEKALAKPENWPPKQDDVWKGTDPYGFETHYHVNSSKKMYLSSFGSSYTPEEILKANKSGKLELVFRPGKTL